MGVGGGLHMFMIIDHKNNQFEKNDINCAGHKCMNMSQPFPPPIMPVNKIFMLVLQLSKHLTLLN